MQEIVVTSTKYPEIVVQGSRVDYTSDVVLIVVGLFLPVVAVVGYLLTALFILLPFSELRRAHHRG